MSKSIQVFALIFGNGINLFLGFLLVPYLSRSLLLADYGTYGQVILVIGFVVSMLSFGMDKVLYADLADKNIDSAVATKSNATIGAVFGVIGLFFLLVFNSWISSYLNNELLSGLILILAFSIPFQLVFRSFTAALIYHGETKKFVIISVYTNIIRLALIFYFVQINYSLECIFASLVFVPLLQCILAYLYLPSFLKKGELSKQVIREQILTGIPLGLTVMISSFFKLTDGFVVSKMLGVEEFAIFRNGAIYIPVIAGVYAAINTIVLPDISRLYGASEYAQIAKLKSRALINTAAIIYPVVIFFALFSFELIPLYLSDKYSSSFIVFSIFNLAILFKITSYEDIYIASKNSSLLPIKYLIVAILNIILNVVLIYLFGIEGAAISTLVSFIVLIVLLVKDSVKIIDVSVNELIPFKDIFKLFTICSLLGVGVLGFYVLIDNLLIIPVLAILFFGSSYYYVLKVDYLEKVVVRDFLGRSKLMKPFLAIFNKLYSN
jgi:O-antigen/teichoic acid export membrane protein